MKQHKPSLIKWFWTMYVWFHLQVYLLRKMATNRIGTKNRRFYICSLSCDVIVYKVKLPDMQLIVSHFVQIELRRPCSMFLGNVETSATPRILPWFTVRGLLVSTNHCHLKISPLFSCHLSQRVTFCTSLCSIQWNSSMAKNAFTSIIELKAFCPKVQCKS